MQAKDRSSRKRPIVIRSIGYERRSIDDIVLALSRAGVRVLIDVRERAWSHRPEYRKTALSDALAAAGILYFHLRSAGNPYRPKDGTQKSFAECARQYRRHLRRDDSPIEELSSIVSQKPSAVFCYEARHDGCHRSIIVDEVLQRLPQARVKEL